jgi:hypothetical protein
VGKGRSDPDAEIRVDNLALPILGGIQSERLAELKDLTTDGLLQRFLPVLMRSAERGNQYHSVAVAEADYDKLIAAINNALAEPFYFEEEALGVRDRVMDYIHKLEKHDGFSSALLGAIGKLRGYYVRLCLVLEVAKRHHPTVATLARPSKPAAFAKLEPHMNKLGAGIAKTISRETAEAVGKLLRAFLLPHMFGFYDLNGGQDRAMLRAIGDFILASPKDRLRPSDFTAGVRALRGQLEQKIREWAGRYCAMGWLEPEELRPGVPPKAWLVMTGLREHFAERRRQAEAARAEAHAILKAGGSRRAMTAL